MKRYKITKEQLERVVENFVMESATEKNMIPAHAPEAKKHVKNKMSGDMVDQSENMPSVTTGMKKKSQAPEAKKNITNKMSGKMVQKSSNVPSTSTGMKKMSQAPEAKKNMAKGTSYMKEEQEMIDEGFIDDIKDIYKTLTTSSAKLHIEKIQPKIAALVRGVEVNDKVRKMNPPTKQDLDNYMKAAKADGFKGYPTMDKNNNLEYSPIKRYSSSGAISTPSGGGYNR